ncbi:MAG: MarR family transcriptional regulator [Candidatus Omnitrophica bacterium]|nr:MarR family transcriptional regulator [Candidatus Omnitrophota bacterium]
MTQAYDEMMRPIGLRVTQLGALSVMAQKGPMTMTQLAEESVTDRTTLTRNLRLLEKREFIVIKKGKDQRQRNLEVTQKGRHILAKARPIWEKAQKNLLKQVGREHLDRLVTDLCRMVSLVRS